MVVHPVMRSEGPKYLTSERMRSGILASVFAIALVPMTVWGQQALLHGTVVDAISGTPLKDAHIVVKGSEYATATDAQGKFSLRCERQGDVVLVVSYIGYAGTERKVSRRELEGKDAMVIRLEPKTTLLPILDVQAEGPEVVYQRTDLHVGAYHANAEGLWVLTYEKPQLWHAEGDAGQQVLRGARLHLLDTDFHERASILMPSDAHALHHDHAQRTLVEGLKEAWFAWMGEDGIELGRIDKHTLHDAVLPWTDSIAGKLLGNNLDVTFPAFDHFARDMATGEDHIFCSVTDAHTLELFRSQYKYMEGRDKVIAMDLALETGIDAEIIAGYMTGFPKDLYFHVPYAPLFVVHDTICVFDHYRERMRRYSAALEVLDEVPITHQNVRDWDGMLLQDAATEEVYVQFSRNARTWIRRIDPRTGELGAATALTYSYPEEVQVYNGYVYYVYRPFGSLQKRTLYREALR